MFKKQVLDINFNKQILNNLIKAGEKHLKQILTLNKEKQNIFKNELNQLNKKLKKIVIDTNLSDLTPIEQQILDREKKEIIKKIISLKSKSESSILDKNYIEKYTKFLNIWYLLALNKDNLYKVRESKFLELFASNFIISSNTSKLVIFDEIYNISLLLVDLMGIEPMYRHKAV